YANYLKYFERARTEFLRERGYPLLDHMGKEIGIIVVRAEVDYKSPARYDDLLDVTTRVSEIANASFTMEQTVLRKRDRKLLASGVIKLACIKNGRPTRIPDSLLEILRE
ncbi:MAG: thioesterase family protein, partial [Pseudomonadota bacterium]